LLAIFRPDLVGILLLAQFAFEILPEVGYHIGADLLYALLRKPLLETFVMDEAHRACTFTRRNQRIISSILLLSQANPTAIGF
jgi:hypothetical protein